MSYEVALLKCLTFAGGLRSETEGLISEMEGC